MNRPDIIYLDTPVELYGIKVMHTYEGLKYLIDHYTTVMNAATPRQLNDHDRAHCVKVIENMTLHVQLYEKQKQLTPTQL